MLVDPHLRRFLLLVALYVAHAVFMVIGWALGHAPTSAALAAVCVAVLFMLGCLLSEPRPGGWLVTGVMVSMLFVPGLIAATFWANPLLWGPLAILVLACLAMALEINQRSPDSADPDK